MNNIHEIARKKLGISQVHLAALLNVSRSKLALAETNRRILQPASSVILSDIFKHFQELENGTLANYRSLETRLFLNEEYRKILPEMQAMEKTCRYKMKLLKQQLKIMKEKARGTEHAIIVLTRLADDLGKSPAEEKRVTFTWLNLLKQQVYDRLLTCWEPEQAKLHIKIEMLAGEARALRRYRINVTRTHGPFKKQGKKVLSL
jgi:transcriptional regulator with XRE-family HTH domain